MAQGLEKPEIERENASRIVWELAWPAVALNSLQVVNTLLDRGFIGHLPTSALTAHGGATNVMFLMFSLALSIATGATALVSRAYGARQDREFRAAAQQSLSLALTFGVVIGLTTFFGAGAFSAFILPRDDPAAIRDMTGFLMAYGIGLPGIAVIQTLAGAMRGIGDTKSPMVISGVQILLHITLNFLLIFPSHDLGFMTLPGAGLGLPGAGLALSISALLSAVAYVVFARHTALGRLSVLVLPAVGWAWRIMRIAIPAAVQAMLRVFSLTVFTLILAVVPNGSEAIAAMSVGFAIESIIIMPAFGLSAAAGALVGQSLGMKRPDRAERLGWTAGHWAGGVAFVLSVPIFFAAPAIAGVLLQGKPEIVAEASVLLRWLCATEVFFSYAMGMIGAMQGAGDTTRTMWITVLSLWGLRVPAAFFLALGPGQALGHGLTVPFGMGLGSVGAWIAMSMTQFVLGILSIAAWKQGKWKLKEV